MQEWKIRLVKELNYPDFTTEDFLDTVDFFKFLNFPGSRVDKYGISFQIISFVTEIQGGTIAGDKLIGELREEGTCNYLITALKYGSVSSVLT